VISEFQERTPLENFSVQSSQIVARQSVPLIGNQDVRILEVTATLVILSMRADGRVVAQTGSMRSSIVGFAFLSLLAACGGNVSNGLEQSDAAPASDASSDDAGDPSRIAAGVYGGDGVRITVANDGSASFQFDCSNGETGPITVTNSGSTGPVFAITGTITVQSPIARPDAGPPAPQSAFFSGHYFGDTISFDYVLDATTSTEFSATLGQPANLELCE
jgi:hypothetical protein